MNRVGHLAFAFLMAICAIVACGVSAWSQELEQQQPVPPSQAPTQPLLPTPVQPPFSPLFGPYAPPPTEGLERQPLVLPTLMTKGGRAQAPAGQTERLLLTPSIAIDETYTDNVFLDNNFKRSDFITSFTPGFLLGFRMPDFGVSVGYVFTSEIYARQTELNAALARWGASVAAFYNLTPRFRLDVAAGYFEDNNTTGSGIVGVSTGRTQSRGATAAPTLTWRFDPLTTIQLRASWYTQSFEQDQFTNVTLSNYDTFTFSPTVARKITPNLTGTFQYQYLFSNVETGQDAEYSLILSGISYQITPDFSASLAAGPQIVTRGETGTTLAAIANLTKSFTWGAIGLNVSRSEAPAGGIGGTSETNLVGLSATITNLLLPNFALSIAPSYSNSSGGGTLGTITSINLQLLATYPVTRWMTAFLSYSYFRQRTTGTDLEDIDANRVTAGVQLFNAIRLR